MKLNKLIILIMVFSLAFTSVVYAEIDYRDLKDDLSSGNTTLEILDLNVLNMSIDVYKAELESKGMQSHLDYFSDLGFSMSGTALSGMMYVRDIVPLQVGYGYETLTSNKELTEASLKVASRQVALGVISSYNTVALSGEKNNFYRSEYESAKLKYDLGQISQSDLLKSEVKYLESKTTLENSQRSLNDSYLTLNQFVGYDLDKIYTVKRESKFEVPLKEPTYYLEFALVKRFEIIDLNKQIDLQNKIAVSYDYGDFLGYYSNHKARQDALNYSRTRHHAFSYWWLVVKIMCKWLLTINGIYLQFKHIL